MGVIQLDMYYKPTINIKSDIKKELSKYKIDKIYNDNIKGKYTLLREIEKELKKQNEYNNYFIDLVNVLLKHYPILTDYLHNKENGIYKVDNNNYRYHAVNKEHKEHEEISCSGPLYCLEMIPDYFFERGII